MRLTLDQKIALAKGQLNRAEGILEMFKDKFFGQVCTEFTPERQLHIINEWTKAVEDHANYLKELTSK